MPSVWQAGKRLGFETRIRPIVRRSRNADCRPRKECDAFAAEASRHKGDMPYSREAVYTDWLVHQFGRRGGAQLDRDRQGWCPSSAPVPSASCTPATARGRTP